ncbi:hypothetical protein [Holzapfeliella floricola]|uniref:Prephenate dehydratase n=1 Tax=Holzapfeliella floricola DSM 23037 = JCM 16512 TaxID=1423744 RepID=A0A0R2DMF8_9LACO|nr:hypothetical protein [Holzapfeliella floricola]KRN04643.1 hypothetical protein FC86_GL000091 [Holzapfeliella floricola DSM 23037 = JCM 16512]
MRIHTLGPKTTDSYLAADHLIDNKKAKIVLHSSFEDIYQNLDDLKNDYFLVPVAYQNHQHQTSFANYHYRYWQKLSIIETFSLETMPMVLLKNLDNRNYQIALHAATTELMNSTFATSESPKPIFVQSKPLAFDAFKNGDCQYAIVSHNFDEYELNHLNYRTLKTFTPQMIWCLYHIN